MWRYCELTKGGSVMPYKYTGYKSSYDFPFSRGLFTCTKCGKEEILPANYCSHCGKELEEYQKKGVKQ